MTKTFKPTRGIGRPFDFKSFTARPVLVLDHSFFTPGVFSRTCGRVFRYKILMIYFYKCLNFKHGTVQKHQL